MREIWFALLAAVVLGAGAPAYAQGTAGPSSPAPGAVAAPASAAAVAAALKLTPNDRILGNPDAPITIIEYASLSCPHCAHFSDTELPQLQKQWIDTGKAKLILRDFPLDAAAMRAALIARCAPPDRFYAFAETFFAAQEQWVLANDQKAALSRLAKLGGMTQQQVDACLTDKALENQIAESRLVAEKDLGVDATPTFFVNGTKMTGEASIAEFDKALSRLSPSSPPGKS
jgi:protein-disulfide isomerase